MVQHIIRADILLIARIFPRPYGARKNITQLAKYPHVLYVKPSNKVYVFTLFCSSVYVFIIALRFLVVEFLFPACYYNPCLNGGTCHEEGGGNYSCECRSGWPSGKRCEVVIGRYFLIIFMVVLLSQHPQFALFNY